MLALYLVPFLLLPSCSKRGRSNTESEVRRDTRVPERFRTYAYPGAKVERIYTGKEASGITMRSPDSVEKVAKFYLDHLGVPDDKVVSSRVISYLYRVRDRDILVTVERSKGGSVISVSITGRGGR